MNERIRELAEQADIPKIDGNWDYNDREVLKRQDGEWAKAVPSEIIYTLFQSEKSLEKFALLIVRECAGINYNSPFQDGEFHARELLDHFGVE